MTQAIDHGARDGLPPCGLYRTMLPMPGREEALPSGRLVYFHNHSTQGAPLVILPQANANNRWSFQDRGFLVQDLGWVGTLFPLLAEGFYTLRDTLRVGDGSMPGRVLVQLGYTREGAPILFPGKRIDNAIVFPARGIGLSPEQLFTALEPTGFLVLEDPPKPQPAKAGTEVH